MATNPIPDVRDVETRLKAIIDYVQDCERRVLKGEIMDLGGLDDNVVEICDIISAMPPRDGRALEFIMAQLIERLEALAVTMREHQEKAGKG